MKAYLDLITEVLENGTEKKDRTGTGTLSIFGAQKRFDLREGFPLVTTKKINYSAVLRELLWFLSGATNINDNLARHTSIWNPWADEKGELGPIYGYQWCKWEKFTEDPASGTIRKSHINQIDLAIEQIKKTPESRRIIVSAWNVGDLDRMALQPCHSFFQFYVVDGRLDCQLYQRSADVAIGVPFNIASYATLTMMMAMECSLRPGYFIHTFGDAHIYLNHIGGVKEQLKRAIHPLPKLNIAKKPFWNLKFEDFELVDYAHEPFIKFDIAV